jgi:hypothetical protein
MQKFQAIFLFVFLSGLALVAVIHFGHLMV